MIYIDTSSLLKLILTDVHSVEVDRAVCLEAVAVVSSLTELEACVQIKALRLRGKLSESGALRVWTRLTQILAQEPFVSRNFSGSIFRIALRQHEMATTHCRSLDRLHLAAMEEFGIKRLMTHDTRQAEAARELGYEVLSPGL